MKRLPTRIYNLSLLFFFVLFAALNSPISAQENKTAKRHISVISTPTGAVVHFDGDYQFIGRTPFIIPYPLVGKYEVKAGKLGYQSVRRNVTFAGDAPNNFQLHLTPKTRIRSASRSLFFPGWGQYYADRKKTGVLYGGAMALSLVYLIRTQRDYLTASRDYDSVISRAQLGGLSYEEQIGLFGQLDSAWINFQRKRDARDLNLYVLAGVWAINVLDALFFFPDYGREVQVFQKFSLNLAPVRGGASIGMSYSIQ